MVPTQELQDAIGKVEASMRIKDLRKLHSDFGQFFCRKVTLGGRLICTKLSKAEANKSEEERKSEYKTSVGASIQAWKVSASVKRDTATTSSTASSAASAASREQHVFEAVGGDTILASKYEPLVDVSP